MSSPDAGAVRSEVDARGLDIGNRVRTAAKATASASGLLYVDSGSTLAETTVTASKPVYIDSSSVPQTGAIPFSMPVSGGTVTTTTFFTITGASTLSTDLLLTYPIVSGAAASSTTQGYIKVSIVDSADNLTDGDYYIPVVTLA